jgi:hypothetical protein
MSCQPCESVTRCGEKSPATTTDQIGRVKNKHTLCNSDFPNLPVSVSTGVTDTENGSAAPVVCKTYSTCTNEYILIVDPFDFDTPPLDDQNKRVVELLTTTGQASSNSCVFPRPRAWNRAGPYTAHSSSDLRPDAGPKRPHRVSDSHLGGFRFADVHGRYVVIG